MPLYGFGTRQNMVIETPSQIRPKSMIKEPNMVATIVCVTQDDTLSGSMLGPELAKLKPSTKNQIIAPTGRPTLTNELSKILTPQNRFFFCQTGLAAGNGGGAVGSIGVTDQDQLVTRIGMST